MGIKMDAQRGRQLNGQTDGWVDRQTNRETQVERQTLNGERDKWSNVRWTKS